MDLHSTDAHRSSRSRRSLRRALAGLVVGGALLAGTTGVASATTAVGGRDCGATVEHSTHDANFVAISAMCWDTGRYVRMAIFDYGANQWVWGNWAHAENGYSPDANIVGTTQVYLYAYVEYAYADGAGWHFVGEWVEVTEALDNMWL
jgi:hypothetical protein